MLEVIDGRDQMTPVHIARPRPGGRGGEPEKQVTEIVDDVRLNGDAALLAHIERLDGVKLTPEELRVPTSVIEKAPSLVRPELVDALEVMTERLRSTCERQVSETWFERRADEFVGELIRPLRRIGVYAPGGRAAYPSTVVMAAVPARVAGVGAIALASPPGPSGEIGEPVLAACAIAGIDEVYRMGGAQAIAALAYGTESVRPVEKIVGPGNIYVTFAQRLVRGWVGVDAEAGPTEIAIVADDTSDPQVVAADLVAQAEHGPLGTHALITWSPELAERVMAALELQVVTHERSEDVENALTEGGRAVLVRDVEHAIDTANGFAPEHLELCFEGADEHLDAIRNAGAVFVGRASPVSVGDYVAGTNHVLPSGGTARWSSGLGVSDFVKRIYVSGLQPSALARLAQHVEALAEAEGLKAHSRAVEIRLGTEPGPGFR
ncbi:MAG: histidinol dehydrogenase [Actinomycetota bacterium]|nr:histidinol dehydrogenase [Actinomycetota bacterium]